MCIRRRTHHEIGGRVWPASTSFQAVAAKAAKSPATSPQVLDDETQEGLTSSDYVKGAIYTVAFALVAVAGPNVVGSDRNSPQAFTKEQMGHHDVATT